MRSEKSLIKTLVVAAQPASVVTGICVVILTVFTFIYGAKDKISPYLIVAIPLVAGVILVIVLVYILVVKYQAQMEAELNRQADKCVACVMDYKKSILSDYRLVTFEQLEVLEKSLLDRNDASECKVYNYTTLEDTVEGEIRKIIKRNIARGIVYKIFYTNQGFKANHRNVELYGKENLIYYPGNLLHNTSSFDILLHISPEGAKGYATVNFTLSNSNHRACVHQRDCHYEDTQIIYKTLPSDISLRIETELSIFLERGTNSADTTRTAQ